MDKVNIVTKPSARRKKEGPAPINVSFLQKKEGRNLHKCTLSMGLKGIVHHLFLSAVKNAVVRFFDEHK